MNKSRHFIQLLLKIVSSLASSYIIYRAVTEFYLVAPGKGLWLGRFSPLWGVAFFVFAICCGLLLAWTMIVLWFPSINSQIASILIRMRTRLGKVCWLIAISAVVTPALFLLFTNWGIPFTTPYFRLLMFLFSSAVFAMFFSVSVKGTKLVDWSSFFLGMVVVASVFLFARLLTNVTNYPFSLSWSEGNRLYDYSVHTDQSRYQFIGELEIPYSSPGRYLLWGIPFLIPGTPIWLHRLWDALLWSVPYIVLGYSLARWSNLDRRAKWLYALWIFLFLEQGPVYSPLIISALLVVLLVNSEHWVTSLVCSGIAGYYASASRWTWLPASAIWATLILLTGFKLEPDMKWSKALRGISPIIVIALFSLAAGSLANPNLYSPKALSSSMTFAQPLLWYRLLPNSTFPYGILWGVLLAAGPLVILLIWLATSRRWALNWLLSLTYPGACVVFLAVGLIASIKIGGGSNLHNLDMLLVTLAILSGLMLRETRLASTKEWPWAARALLILALFLPSWKAMSAGTTLDLPPQERVSRALELLREKVSKAQEDGEVLFIDQRQLITFGHIHNLALVSQYEKKYMMDQAMASDVDYFSHFYTDLKNKRFTLIVTEPLYTKEQDASRGFSEENNAWVKWVAKPLLCYYAPSRTFTDVNLQMLVPRANPTGCP